MLRPSQDSLPFLRDDEVAARLDTPLLTKAIDDAFRLNRYSYVMPQRMILPQGEHTVLVMPCFAENIFGVKIVTMMRTSGGGHRVLKANYTLYDGKTGDALVFAEADALTDLRTAATSAVATRALANPGAAVLGIFGTGRQAKAHLTVLCRLFPFREVLICGSSRERGEAFVKKNAASVAAPLRAVDQLTCARQSDILCTCTTSTTPVFDGKELRPGCHVNAVGSFRPDMRELDDETMRRARVVVDTYEGAPIEAGDILIPQQSRAISMDHVVADLHEALSGKVAVRRDSQDVTVFKSVGCALEDLAAARLLVLVNSDRKPDVESDPDVVTKK
jgi:ornithine cyclodeaminase/alanine dehydrogenase-like protein (mu-crystallin family)